MMFGVAFFVSAVCAIFVIHRLSKKHNELEEDCREEK